MMRSVAWAVASCLMAAICIRASFQWASRPRSGLEIEVFGLSDEGLTVEGQGDKAEVRVFGDDIKGLVGVFAGKEPDMLAVCGVERGGGGDFGCYRCFFHFVSFVGSLRF